MDIVGSLFGISPVLDSRNAELQARQDALGLGTLFGAAGVNEYATPERQQAYINKQAAQFALGDLAVRKIGGLFGLETPELKRASTIESTLAGLQDELSAEQMADPRQLYPKLIERLQQAGLGKEAFLVARQAGIELTDLENKSLDREIKLMTKEDIVSNRQVKAQKDKAERIGQLAYGGLTALQKIKDPSTATAMWERTLAELEKQGVDVSVAKDLPWEQRQGYLESVVDTSTTADIRSREEVAALKIQQQQQQQAWKQELDMLKFQLTNERLSFAEQKAIEDRAAALERALLSQENLDRRFQLQNEMEDKRQAWRTQQSAADTVDTKETRKNAKKNLQELNVPEEQMGAAVEDYVTIKQTLLSEKDENGYPRYTPQAAEALAWDQVQSNISTQKGRIFDSTTYNRKKATPKAPAAAPVAAPATSGGIPPRPANAVTRK